MVLPGAVPVGRVRLRHRRRADDRARHPCFPETVVHHPPTVALLLAAHDAAEGDDLASSTLARTAFAALLSRHASRRPPGTPRWDNDPAVRRAREILHERLVGPPTIEDLARAVGMSPFALIRAFKAATGLPRTPT